jgi:hypothetical protein
MLSPLAQHLKAARQAAKAIRELEQTPGFLEMQRAVAEIHAAEAELLQEEQEQSRIPETVAGDIDPKPSGRPPGISSASGCRRVTDYLNRPGNNKEKLAAASGVTPRTIQRIKAGDSVSQDVWTDVARGMGLSFDALIAP